MKRLPVQLSIWLLLMPLIYSACNKVDVAISDPVPNCFDGIQNQGEIEVDCGGPCPTCSARMTATINGILWESQGAITTQVNGNSILINGNNSSSSLSLIYTGSFVNGTFSLAQGSYQRFSPLTNYTTNTGSITFTEWVWSQPFNLVFGNFNFNAIEVTGTGDSVVVQQGKFSFVTFTQ